MCPNRQIPRGIEVLVKKASVDAAFRDTLLTKRAVAAAQIGLELNPAETAMLTAIPESQLIGIIQNTRVSPKARPVFMGYAAAAMLAAVGVVTGCGPSGEEAVLEETASPIVDEPPAETGENTPDSPEIESDYSADGLGISGEGVGGGGSGDATGGSGGGITGIRPDGSSGPHKPGKENTTLPYKNANVFASCSTIGGPGADDENRTLEILDRIVSNHITSFELLFRNQSEKNPKMEGGKVTVRFIIAANGTVPQASIESNDIGSSTLASGILARIRDWKFPAASDEVTVVLPIVFVVTE